MARHRPIHGGPYDGHAWRSTSALILIAGRVYRYERDAYVFQGHRSFQCAGCGGYITPPGDSQVEACPLCRHEAPPHARR